MNLKQTLANYSLLQHPFYKLWLDGKLPKEAIQKYCGQYFQLVSHLPRFISQLHMNCEDERTRQILIHNLMEEELGHENGDIAHTQLWLDFAEEMGASRDETINAELLPETKAAISKIKTIIDQSTAEGAAALYAYESQVPEISEEKIGSLKAHYHITSEKGLKFFEVHSWADKKHGAVWESLVHKHGQDEETLQQASTQTAKALWELFDGMYREYVPVELKA